MRSILHLTSVHRRDDTRIFHKMCKSGAAHGFRMALIVADGNGDAEKDGISIHDVGKSKGRIDRMWRATNRVYQAAISLNADIYHLHDPELMPIGLKLKRRGKRVVFDAHEDLPKQLLSKHYLNNAARHVLAGVLSRYETYACARVDGVIAATPFIRNKFIKANARTIDICNYPLVAELEGNLTWQQKSPEVCYVGGLHRSRGIINLLRSISACRTPARLTLCGSFESSGFEREVRMLPQWELVNYQGSVGREQIRNTMSRAMAGLVTLLPRSNYLEALPVKMFEYMSAGIPVIASDFPLWRAIVADNDCGLLVNPLDPKHIAGAIDELLCNPERACRLGQNGRKAVEKQYNWEIEEQKLLGFYEGILGAKRN